MTPSVVFFSFQELKDVLRTVPEIVEMIGDADSNRVLLLDNEDEEEDLKSALRSAFTLLMSATKLLISRAISDLKRRLHSESEVTMQCFITFSVEAFCFNDPFFLPVECRNQSLSQAMTFHSLLQQQ